MNIVFLHNLMYTFRLECKFIIIKLFSRAYPSNNAGRIFLPGCNKKEMFLVYFLVVFLREKDLAYSQS